MAVVIPVIGRFQSAAKLCNDSVRLTLNKICNITIHIGRPGCGSQISILRLCIVLDHAFRHFYF